MGLTGLKTAPFERTIRKMPPALIPDINTGS